MKRMFKKTLWGILISGALISCSNSPKASVICPENASRLEKLAAKELRRYIYQTTGELMPIISSDLIPGKKGDCFIIASRDAKILSSPVFSDSLIKELKELEKEDFLLKTVEGEGGKICLVCGGEDIGTLYGAYDLAEQYGVRFYLHGDVIPDQKSTFLIPDLDKTERPLFKLRGIQPFHDFPEGPDWWSKNDYKAVLSQLPKLKMNFVGFHTYPKGSLGPEPTVWIGLPEDCNPDGSVEVSDATSWHNTQRYAEYGCYRPKKTDEFSYGGADIFESDNYGPEVNTVDDFPFPKTPEQSNAMIGRTGEMLNEVLGFAQSLGIKTCVGTEAPLNIPQVVVERLEQLGKDPSDPAVVQELYEGMFKRIIKTYPIDYYWFWGFEGPIEEDAFQKDVLLAIAAKEKLNAPFELGICGWGWIANNFPLLDKVLPKDLAFSCISGSLGREFVHPNFDLIQRDEKWAIPWFEDDNALISPQLHVGRLRKDAADALEYGCSGLMGLHWRTRILGPNIAVLARSAWNQENYARPETETDNPRYLPVESFYKDWAYAQFGSEVAKEAAQIFINLDEKFPETSRWDRGPGTIAINESSWEKEQQKYAFVSQMDSLRPRVLGRGNMERFDYWLNQFLFVKAMAQVGCKRGELDRVMNQIDAEGDTSLRLSLAKSEALPLRIELNELLGEMYGYLLSTFNNSSEMGTVSNVEQQSMLRLKLLTFHDEVLEQILQEKLPMEAFPWKEYRGAVRIVVPTKRSAIDTGEILQLKVIILGNKKVKKIVLRYKKMGSALFQEVPLTHVARAVYSLKLPPFTEDLEYYIEAECEDGQLVFWPASAPELNHTVLVLQNAN